MKSFLSNLTKEMYLITRTKLFYFLLVLIIVSSLLIPLYNQEFLASILKSQQYNSFSDLLYLRSSNRLFVGLFTFTIFVVPAISASISYCIFDMDKIGNSRRLKYVFYDYNINIMSKIFLLLLLNIVTVTLFVLMQSLFINVLDFNFDSSYIINQIGQISHQSSSISILISIFFGFIISIISSLINLAIKNLYAVLIIVVSYIYVTPVFVKSLRFQFIGLYKSILSIRNEEVLNEYLQSKDLLDGWLALIIVVFSCIILTVTLKGGLKWQEKY